MSIEKKDPVSKIKCENVEVKRKKAVYRCDCFQSGRRRDVKRKFLHFNFKTVLGIVVSALGVLTIYLNETRAIRFTLHFNKALNSVVQMDGSQFLPEHEGKLVYLYGKLQVDEPLADPEYGVSVQCVKLKQRVQMFQWVEYLISHEYVYEGEWKSKLIDSREFLFNDTHKNPTKLPLESKIFVNEGVRVGEYYISDEFKNEFKDFTQVTSDERPENKNIKLHFGLYYHSENVWKPEIGDIRVQFSYAGLHGEDISVVGKQIGRVIYPYYNMSHGYHINYIRLGHRSPLPDMLHTTHYGNIWSIRGFRLLALILMHIASHLIFQQKKDADFLNLLVSVSSTAVTTSYVWYWHYPAFSGKLLLTALISPLILTMLFGKKFKHFSSLKFWN